MDAREKLDALERLRKRLPPDSKLHFSCYIETDMHERAMKAAKALATEVGGEVYCRSYKTAEDLGLGLYDVVKDGEHVATITWTVPQDVSVSQED